MKKTIYRIEDIAEVKSGKRIPKGMSFVNYKTDYKYIRARDIKNGAIHSDELVYIDDEVKKKIDKYIIEENDIAITIVGENIGDVGICPREISGSNLTENACRLTCYKLDKVFPKYLLYYLNQKHMKEHMQLLGSGAAQGKLGNYKTKRMKIELPNLNVQRKIAEEAEKYDCLIENNNKRIKILEQMALELYKEWFVRFRYDSKEIEYQESNLGMIPSTFNVVPIGELIDYYIGGGWGNDTKSDEYCEEAFVIRGADFPNVRIGDISTTPLRFHKKSNYDKRKLLPGDIVIEISGGTEEKPVGRTILITDELLTEFSYSVICASFCKLIRVSKEKISPIYLHYWMNYMYETRMIDRFQLQSTGIINFKFEYFLRKGLVLIPPKDLMVEFERKIKILKKQIDSLSIKNSNLREQRDLLLPRLMSGKLEIKESE